MRFNALALLFATSSCLAAENLDIKLQVEKFKLKNGLTVLLHQDRNIPMVSYHTWYRVGSRNESKGTTGAAHMLEHMMFKGAKKYTDKDFEKILHSNGIQNNAFTSWDYTGFYENLPSSKLELIMDVEVDRMRFLSLKPEHLKSELQVVGEERRWRVDNNPPSRMREATLEMLFEKHPYRWPVIGYMTDIQAYTVEKLRFFYDRFYVPNNAVLVIAGDIDIEKTRLLVEKYYGQLEYKEVPKQEFPQEPEPTKEKRKTIHDDVQNESILVAYKGVAAGHPDSYALDLAASILGSGTSSRLYRTLVYQQQKASAAASYNLTNADPGIFSLMAMMKPKESSQVAEMIFEKEIARLQNEMVSAKELEKAKNNVMKDYIDSLSSIDGKAQALAVNEIIFNDYQRLFTELGHYQKVTAKDILRVSKRYLAKHRRVTTVLAPKGNQQGNPR